MREKHDLKRPGNRWSGAPRITGTSGGTAWLSGCRWLYGLAGVMLVMPLPAVAWDSPKEWYEPSPLDDNDGDKIEDLINAMALRAEVGGTIDAVICFRDDCIPDNRVAELSAMGTIGYASTVVTSLAVKGILIADLIATVAPWPEVGYIHLDHIVEPMMSTAGAALKAHAGFYSPNTAQDQGWDGMGITIAILDTGVDNPGGGGPGITHTHLAGAWAGAPGVAGLFIDAASMLAFGDPDDQHSHGTAVAGCALGRGTLGCTAPGSANRGVACAARLFDCRITPPGAGGSTTLTNIQQVVDWLTWNGGNVVPPVRVANLSFGNSAPSAGTALTASLEALAASGVVLTVAAGNNDTCAGTGIGHIAVTTRAITVASATHGGTVDRTLGEAISSYSTTGPGLGLSPKPDITAYGSQCTFACPGACISAVSFGINTTLLNSATGYTTTFGGTSAASPMVAGAAALIIERNPAISPAAVKTLLMTTAQDFGAAGWDSVWGAGLMDLGPIFPPAPPATCDLEVQTVSYTPPVTCFVPEVITVTVRNAGATPVTNFDVDWERWYFGPSQPVQRFPIGGAPTPNTLGPLLPGATRTFTRSWTPGVSDMLPLSMHTCFWGIVSAACDTNASNNERNVNADIIGVMAGGTCTPGPIIQSEGPSEALGGQCNQGFCSHGRAPCVNAADCGPPVCDFNFRDCSPGQPPCQGPEGPCVNQTCLGVPLVQLPFRVAHDQFFPQNLIVVLQNFDPFNWQAELEYNCQINPNGLVVSVDNQACPVWMRLRASPVNPDFTPPAPMQVIAFDELNAEIGRFDVIVDVNPPAVNPPAVAPAPHNRRKNRYISFTPNNGTNMVAFRVQRTTAPTGSCWVQAPVTAGNDINTATCGANPVFRVWNEPVLHVGDCEIIPVQDYMVFANAPGPIENPVGLAVSTILVPNINGKLWADSVGGFNGVEWTPPNQIGNVNDVLDILARIAGAAGRPEFPVANLSSTSSSDSCLSPQVNAADVLAAVQAVAGASYGPPSSVRFTTFAQCAVPPSGSCSCCGN